MALRSRLSAALTAAAMALGSIGVLASTAHAATVLTLKVGDVDAGQTATITVSGCSTERVHSGSVVEIASLDNPDDVVLSQELGLNETTVSFTPTVADAYEVTFTCMSYDGTVDTSTSQVLFAWPLGMDISPEQWQKGDTITLTGWGFQPGETVTLTMTDKSSGEVIFVRAAAATVDDQGVFTYAFVPPYGDGSYVLTAVGDTSGVKRTAEFSWGEADPEQGGDSTQDGGDQVPDVTKPTVMPTTGN